MRKQTPITPDLGLEGAVNGLVTGLNRPPSLTNRTPLYVTGPDSVVLDCTHDVISVNTTAGNVTLLLPDALAAARAQGFTIAKTDSTANTITILPTRGQALVGTSTISTASKVFAYPLKTGTGWATF